MDIKHENPCHKIAVTKDNVNPHRIGSDTSSSYYSGRHDWWVPDFDSDSSKRKHEFLPILLINSTVWDCKHCKRKKEDCASQYCTDEDNPPNYNSGEWG